MSVVICVAEKSEHLISKRKGKNQVAGGAGFSTSPQTRPAKLLFVAYTAQRQNFGGPTLNSLLKPADTEQTHPHGFFFSSAGLAKPGCRRRPAATIVDISTQPPRRI